MDWIMEEKTWGKKANVYLACPKLAHFNQFFPTHLLIRLLQYCITENLQIWGKQIFIKWAPGQLTANFNEIIAFNLVCNTILYILYFINISGIPNYIGTSTIGINVSQFLFWIRLGVEIAGWELHRFISCLSQLSLWRPLWRLPFQFNPSFEVWPKSPSRPIYCLLKKVKIVYMEVWDKEKMNLSEYEHFQKYSFYYK